MVTMDEMDEHLNELLAEFGEPATLAYVNNIMNEPISDVVKSACLNH